MKLKSYSVDTHGQQNHSQVKQLQRVRKDNEENNMDWLRTGSSGVSCDVLAVSRQQDFSSFVLPEDTRLPR